MLTMLSILAVATLLAALGWGRRSRRRFAEDEHSFECRFRACGPAPAGWRLPQRRWSRWMWARWTGEMLVVRRGPVLNRTLRLAPRIGAPGVFRPAGQAEQTPGIQQIMARLTVGGRTVEIIASGYMRTQLVGPYLAAAVTDLPKAPVPRGEL